MNSVDKALETQLSNIEAKLGKDRHALIEVIKATGLTRHSDIVTWLKNEMALGHGDANSLTHFTLRGGSFEVPQNAEAADVLVAIYKDKKAHQRPIHEALMREIETFGAFEVAPKKGYVSLRRKKQFAMLGPKTNERFELGLNLKEDIDDPRVQVMPAGGMCNYVVPLTEATQIDSSLIGIIRRAFDAAG